jgi:hypothetical protein
VARGRVRTVRAGCEACALHGLPALRTLLQPAQALLQPRITIDAHLLKPSLLIWGQQRVDVRLQTRLLHGKICFYLGQRLCRRADL